nr:globin domain-containing protein [uncultured Celeribacter sp.]
MDRQRIALVQDSFGRLRPHSDRLVILAYENYFAMHPDQRALFPKDLTLQGIKVMSTLAVLVHGLKDLDSLLPRLSELAQIHADYDVSAAHYQDFGTSLISAIETCLGAPLTPEEREAWSEAYSMWAKTMLRAASGQERVR